MPKRGGSRGRKKPSLHDLTREQPTEKDLPAFYNELLSGTDRSSAIVACELVNTALFYALISRMVHMLQEDGEALFYAATAPLNSFSARIKLGKALGIYGTQIFEQLETIRRIRNVFAHSLKPFDFTHEVIAAECATLADMKLGNYPGGLAKKHLHPLRERYIAVCTTIMMLLLDIYYRNFFEPKSVELTDRENGSLPPWQDISVLRQFQGDHSQD